MTIITTTTATTLLEEEAKKSDGKRPIQMGVMRKALILPPRVAN